MIAARRLAGDEASESDRRHHVETGLWQLARLLTVVADYVDRYGERTLHGEIAYNAESVIRLAGWTGS